MADTSQLVYSTSTSTSRPNPQRRREVRYVICPTCGYEREAGYLYYEDGRRMTCGLPCV